MKTVSIDLETELILPGNKAPPIVCGAFSDGQTEELRLTPETIARFKEHLASDFIVGANIFYDFGCLCAADPTAVPLVFKALEEGRVWDTHLAEALHDNAKGWLFRDPISLKPFSRYSQGMLEERYLELKRTKNTDKTGTTDGEWRLRYARLLGLPLVRYPEEAAEYPKADVRGAWGISEVQRLEERLNRQCMIPEARGAWFMRLTSMWGMRTDPVLVPQVVEEMQAEHERTRALFLAQGLVTVVRCKRKKDKAGESVLEDADDISPEIVQDRLEASTDPEERKELARCLEALAEGRTVRYKTITSALRAHVSEAYQGNPPLTYGGESGDRKVSTARDTLQESGVELLEDFAKAGPGEKHYAAFSDLLERGTKHPICAEYNYLVDSGRASCRDPNLQQLPRGGRIRECFVPRPGWAFLSTDYSTLELCTLAQVCLWVVGWSRMAEALNAGQDLHTRLAGRIAGGVPYEEMRALIKAADKSAKNLRQLSKPINFGLPGLMGPVKLVATARKDGVRFCELAGVSEKCGTNGRLVEWTYHQGRAPEPIFPTCKDCLDLAVVYRQAWRAEFPEVTLYHDFTKECARAGAEGEPLESFGNGMLRLTNEAGAASNHYFQNLAAQGAKHAGWMLAKECYVDRTSPLYGVCRPVVFVHDEVITEVRLECLTECAERQTQILEQSMREFVPDVLVKAPAAAALRWYKGMEPVCVNGRLQPWEPACKCKADGWEKPGGTGGCPESCAVGKYRELRRAI